MKRFAVFLAGAVTAAALLAVVGRMVMPDRYGPEAIAAVDWAVGVALFGSIAGALPLVVGGTLSPATDGPAAASRFLASMIVRLVAVGLGAGAAVVVASVALEPFLLWLGASYLLLLVVDTAFVFLASRSL